jgi:hypothetical protein
MNIAQTNAKIACPSSYWHILMGSSMVKHDSELDTSQIVLGTETSSAGS